MPAAQASAHIGTETYRTQVHLASHTIQADEPADLGGTDTGPTPYELLLASLGACTAITLRMYADRKNLPLEAVEVNLALDVEKTDGGQKTRITREIKLLGGLDAAARQRMLEIANNCPVHRLLVGEIEINSKLRD